MNEWKEEWIKRTENHEKISLIEINTVPVQVVVMSESKIELFFPKLFFLFPFPSFLYVKILDSRTLRTKLSYNWAREREREKEIFDVQRNMYSKSVTQSVTSSLLNLRWSCSNSFYDTKSCLLFFTYCYTLKNSISTPFSDK